ncbi:hypothetical protein L6V77_08260 [Myxococcota bacterium]|nr:hypothetical protein [Myxococcota bacterium]
MMDLKKLLALGLVSMMGMVACDVEEDDAAAGDAGATCPANDGTDGTVPEVCVPGEGDAGEVCGCPEAGGAGGEGGGGAAGGAGGNIPEPDAPIPTVEWTDEKTLVLTVDPGAENGPYVFGFAETGNGGGDGWDGEDCIPGVNDGHDICHPVPDDGKLTLTSIHPSQGGPAAVDGIFETLVAGETTLMYKTLAPGLTYILIRQADDDNCWVWGHDPDHYNDEFGCNPVTSP